MLSREPSGTGQLSYPLQRRFALSLSSSCSPYGEYYLSLKSGEIPSPVCSPSL